MSATDTAVGGGLAARAEASSAARRYDIDLIRVSVCLIMFFFHVAKVFDDDPVYHVKNADLSPTMTVFTVFVHRWAMPLFFFIAGWASAVMLARRSDGCFVGDRLRRLLPPFLFGIVLLCPPIKYLERLSGRDLRPSGFDLAPPPFDLSFLEFLPRFFGRLNEFGWSHMWFLAYLLVFSIVLVPLLRALERLRDAGRPRRWWAYAPLLPLLAVEFVMRPIWGDYPNLFADWASMSVFVIFFAMGALVARHPGIEAMVAAEWAGLGVIGVLGLALHFSGSGPWSGLVANACMEWGIVGCLYGLGRRWQGGDRPLFAYFRDATLPFYVLHHAPSVVLAFFVVALPLDLWTKALIILVGTGVITFGFYHFLVRPFPAMRWLMGLRPLP